MSNQTQHIAGFLLAPQQEHAFLLSGGVPATPGLALVGEATPEPELRAALEQLVSTHEILRTTFVRPAGMRVPQQVISDALAPAWRSAELGSGALDELLGEEAAALDLESGPVLRGVLVTLPGGERALVLTAAAVCVDGASMLLLLRDLAEPGSSVADAEPLQYADYAAWRREVLEEGGADVDTARSWWGQDADRRAPQLLFGRAVEAVGPTARVSVTLAAIGAAAEQLHVPAAVFLEACAHALVCRLSADDELTLAGLVGGRAQPDLAGAVGPFAQWAPIRSRIEAETTFAELVDQVRRARADANRWHDFGSVEQLAIGTRPSIGYASYDASGTGLRRLSAPSGARALEFVVQSSGDALDCELLYDSAAYDIADAELIAGCFSTLVASAAVDPAQPVAHLQLLDPARREAVLALSDGGVAPIPGTPLHHAFEWRAAAAPASLAVTDGAAHLTHAELNAAANRLAHHLANLGIGRGQTVALCVDRSVGAVVALLGILKSGAAFVPLNFEHPSSRLAHQLEEAGVAALVTQEPLLSRLPAYDGPVVCLDRDATALAAEPAHDPVHVTQLDDLAYVMYTSGSTGLPKGVAVTHANVANYAARMLDRFGTNGGLSFGVVSALSTDLGYTSVFPPLSGGGSVHLISPDVVLDPDAFAAHMSEAQIDVLKITPSLLGALLGTESRSVLPRRWLVCGGEAFSLELLERIRALGGSCRILNHYGPTETTIGTCVGEVCPDATWPSATVPIGRPLENSRLYIVDETGQPTPPGVSGELLIGGAGVARGYLNRPAETEERFAADPFSDLPNARVYRTGDRARFLPDGSIEFVGRIDEQVKIRGYRVEPGEIEATLQRHPAVRQAAVVAHGAAGDQRLAAYVVASPQPSVDELDLFLHDWLPEYMLPSIIPIDVLPLTPSGKVDRRALPDPAEVEVGGATEYVAPRNEIEHEIAEIWQELLGVEQVGVTDDFFALGGHSLLATQMITRIRRRHGNVPLRALFVAPTIGALAEAVAGRSNGHGG